MKTATLGQGAKVLQMIIDKETANEHLQWILGSGVLSDLLDANSEGFDREAYRKFLGLEPLNPPLLLHVGTAMVPATKRPFVARDCFIQNATGDASVRISHVGDDFRAWFLGKEEPPFGGSILRYGTLSRSSSDGFIIAALGGEEKAEITLTELFLLMQAQKNGERGPLLANRWANIFYVRDVSRMLRAVYVYCYRDEGWCVDAYAVASINEWRNACRVFSRDSR